MSREKKPLPTVTVIMPIRQEEAFIRTSLGSVLDQDYPADLVEVLVVDGMSTDRTREIVLSMAQVRQAQKGEKAGKVELLDNPKGIVPTAMNLALQRARGEVLVRVDGHCEPAPDFLRRSLEVLIETGAAVVGPALETVGETSTAQAIAVAMSSPFGVGGAPFRVENAERREVDTLAFGAYQRSAIASTGWFDEELVRNQDDEYNYRLRARGGKILLDPTIRCRYFSRGSLRSLARQYFQYGWWKVRVLQKHPRQMQWRHFVPPAFAAALLFGLGLALGIPLGVPGTPVGRWFLGGLVLAYGLANGFATLSCARRSPISALPIISAAFALLHVCYGVGFLAGLLRFAGRWGDRKGGEPDLSAADLGLQQDSFEPERVRPHKPNQVHTPKAAEPL